MHWEDGGTTCKAAMDALNDHFQPKKNVVCGRHVFRQAIQGTNKPSINLSQDLVNLPPCGNLSIKIPKSKISSLIRVHLIAYVVVS